MPNCPKCKEKLCRVDEYEPHSGLDPRMQKFVCPGCELVIYTTDPARFQERTGGIYVANMSR